MVISPGVLQWVVSGSSVSVVAFSTVEQVTPFAPPPTSSLFSYPSSPTHRPLLSPISSPTFVHVTAAMEHPPPNYSREKTITRGESPSERPLLVQEQAHARITSPSTSMSFWPSSWDSPPQGCLWPANSHVGVSFEGSHVKASVNLLEKSNQSETRIMPRGRGEMWWLPMRGVKKS